MDYEKLHKDTITKLREMVNSGKITVEVARGICADFEPESEDERIRKAIKSAVLQLTDIYLQEKYGLKQSDCIAWLEKQGEQKPAENKGINLVEEEMTPFQKKVFCIIDTTIEEEQGLKQVCDELLRLAHDEIKKAAWSEEDDRMLHTIIADLKGFSHNNTSTLEPHFNECIDWLKSLRPHNAWKPSEEQIECLYDAINNYHTNGYPASKLNELYEQMSKIYKL